ncbi:hypothetical protein J6590_009793 [Homalodisca vitripennis]|nr:hypothetical protein J6590_009793 [Homalodisca vitripennis]
MHLRMEVGREMGRGEQSNKRLNYLRIELCRPAVVVLPNPCGSAVTGHVRALWCSRLTDWSATIRMGLLRHLARYRTNTQ